MNVLAQLKAERDRVVQQLNALDTAIRALSGFDGRRARRRPRRRLTAAARARIAAAQRARWAKAKGLKVVSIGSKIAAAQRARWARWRAAKK